MSELRAQAAEAVKARRMRQAKTRTSSRYARMSRRQLENLLEQERRHKFGPSAAKVSQKVSSAASLS